MTTALGACCIYAAAQLRDANRVAHEYLGPRLAPEKYKMFNITRYHVHARNRKRAQDIAKWVSSTPKSQEKSRAKGKGGLVQLVASEPPPAPRFSEPRMSFSEAPEWRNAVTRQERPAIVRLIEKEVGLVGSRLWRATHWAPTPGHEMTECVVAAIITSGDDESATSIAHAIMHRTRDA